MCIYTTKFPSYLSLEWQGRIQPWIDWWMAQTPAKFGNFACQIKIKIKKWLKVGSNRIYNFFYTPIDLTRRFSILYQ